MENKDQQVERIFKNDFKTFINTLLSNEIAWKMFYNMSRLYAYSFYVFDKRFEFLSGDLKTEGLNVEKMLEISEEDLIKHLNKKHYTGMFYGRYAGKYSECDVLRYKASLMIENLLTEFDPRIQRESYNKKQWLEYFKISQEEYKQLHKAFEEKKSDIKDPTEQN